MGRGHSQNVGVESATASSKPLIFVNAHTLGFYPTLQLSLVQCVQVDWGIF
jgi:hypothetical protein